MNFDDIFQQVKAFLSPIGKQISTISGNAIVGFGQSTIAVKIFLIAVLLLAGYFSWKITKLALKIALIFIEIVLVLSVVFS